MNDRFRPFDRLKSLLEEKHRLNSELRVVQDELNLLEPKCLDIMQGSGVQSFNRNGVTFARRRQFYARTKPGVPKEEIIRVFTATGCTDMLMLSSNSIRARMREAEAAGKSLPAELLNVIDAGMLERMSVGGISPSPSEADGDI
jgi:hypothetical protein